MSSSAYLIYKWVGSERTPVEISGDEVLATARCFELEQEDHGVEYCYAELPFNVVKEKEDDDVLVAVAATVIPGIVDALIVKELYSWVK